MPITADGAAGGRTRRLRIIPSCGSMYVDRGRAATPYPRSAGGFRTLLATNAHPRYTGSDNARNNLRKDDSSRPLSRFQAHVQTLQCRHPVPGSGLARAGRALPRIRHSRAPCSLDPHMREDNHAMELNGAHINPPIPTSIYHSMRRGLEDACLAGGRSKPGRHRQSASLRVRYVPDDCHRPGARRPCRRRVCASHILAPVLRVTQR